MENENPNQLPPKFEVKGVWRDDKEVVDALDNYFNGAEAPRLFPGETEPTPEQTKQLAALGAAFVELGQDLGLDLKERIPAPEKYHFFETKEALHEALRSMGFSPSEDTEALTLTSGLYILSTGDRFSDLCMAAHETVHYLAQKKVGTSETEAPDGQKGVYIKGMRQGYRYMPTGGDEAFQGLDEIACEFTYLDLLNGGYWDRQPDLPKAGDRNPTHYTGLDIIGEELVLAAANETGADPLTIIKGMERDVLIGKSEGLRVVTGYLAASEAGTEGVRKLIQAPHTDREGKFLQLAKDLNLPKAVARIEALDEDRSKPANVLTWIRNQDNSEKAA